jgi:hypothetical protein
MNLDDHRHLNTGSSIFSERYAPFFKMAPNHNKLLNFANTRFENVAVQEFL